ncbi:MAG TPA: hypothetical protein VMB83_15715 [Roseiarcus sp.]|nr:hypothetical protein [Roseiarcus sp.]
MRGERGRDGDERRGDQHRPHEGKPIPNSERNGSCLRLPYGCCNGALLGQNAESTPFRSDLSCTAASTNYFIATPRLFGEGDAARIDDADAHGLLAPALEGFSPTPEMPEIAEAQALMERLA